MRLVVGRSGSEQSCHSSVIRILSETGRAFCPEQKRHTANTRLRLLEARTHTSSSIPRDTRTLESLAVGLNLTPTRGPRPRVGVKEPSIEGQIMTSWSLYSACLWLGYYHSKPTGEGGA